MNTSVAPRVDQANAVGNKERISHERPFEENLGFVKFVVSTFIPGLRKDLDLDDLIQAGSIALFEAQNNYDPEGGATFATYAYIRIRGAIFDEIRKSNWASRGILRSSRAVYKAEEIVRMREGRAPHDSEVAAELGITLEKLHTIRREAEETHIRSLESVVYDPKREGEVPNSEEQPLEDYLASLQLSYQLHKAIRSLPERNQVVLALYFDHEVDMKTIGDILGVSESRVSQIVSDSTLRLRNKFNQYLEV